MSKQLPLNALRVFEAAARHLSFRLAAEELHITPSAVSQQVRSLEQLLDGPLFYRMSRSVALTPRGSIGLQNLRKGFDQLAEALRQMKGDETATRLAVWVAPSFASKWLVPRLPLFTAAHPGIELSISVSEALIDRDQAAHGSTIEVNAADNVRQHHVDLAIRFGRGKHPECQVDRLFAVSAVPLCSPRLLESGLPLRTPEDLAGHTLLHDDTAYEGRPEWVNWASAAGLDSIDANHGMHFNSAALAIEAAVDGQGVVLGLEPLARDDLAAGRLIIPFGPPLPLEYAYNLVTPTDALERAEVSLFRDWLLAEAGVQPDEGAETPG